MNFVQQLEECLRDLAAEARKKHPGVKEASERATLRLRSLQNQYVQAVRQASSRGVGRTSASSGGGSGNDENPDATAAAGAGYHPTTRLFASSDLLHPFLLAANYSTASPRLLEITFRAMRLLMEADAIIPTDGLQMVRVWTIQAQVVVTHYEKVYAKELRQQQQILMENEASLSDDLDTDEAQETNSTATSVSTGNNTNTSAASTFTSATSSWFGWTTGATNNPATSTSTTLASAAGGGSTTASVSSTAKAVLKNAGVSSSTGQTGPGGNQASSAVMERLALEILSSLLQLLELLRQYPDSLTTELWTHAVTLACLWLQSLPHRHTVQQAAKSTVHQVISLLYQQFRQSAENKESSSVDDTSRTALTATSQKFLAATWDDLLALTTKLSNGTLSESSTSTASSGIGSNSSGKLNGAFALCKKTRNARSASSSAWPPPADVALELLTQVLKEGHYQPSPNLLDKTWKVTLRLLHQAASTKTQVEKAFRTIQWTLALYQRMAVPHPDECRELFLQLVEFISMATEVCRSHPDFEDGYVYSLDEAVVLGDRPAPLEGTSVGSSSHGSSAADGSGAAGPGQAASRRRTTSTAGSSTVGLVSFFPLPSLWKAGLALEAVYLILENDTEELMVLFQHHATVAALAEALSDFCTIGASCRDHMLQVVDFTRLHNIVANNQKPTLFRKAEQALGSGNPWTVFGEDIASAVSDRGVRPPSSNTTVLGEALWIAFQGMLRISACLHRAEDTLGLVEDTFASLLAGLQHYLKRFVASEDLVHLALEGYESLAHVCLPLQECSMQRKALQTSLCKLSLPSWGKSDPRKYLEDHHIRSLLTLLKIVHHHYDEIESEWDLILWTFDELSVLSIASPRLKEESYHASLAISAVYSRFAPFSACFSNSSLMRMTEALAEITKSSMQHRDVVGDNDTVLLNRSSSNFDRADNFSGSSQKSAGTESGAGTISDRLMSMGVRAIYGGNGDELERGEEIQANSFAERTRNVYYEDYRQEFVQRMTTCEVAVRVHAVGRLPFVLALLADVAMVNVFRPKECGDMIYAQLSDLAASAPAIRPFVMDTMTMLIMSKLTRERNILPAPFRGPGQLVFPSDPMQSQLLAVDTVKNGQSIEPAEEPAQIDILRPLCESISETPRADVAESVLGVLNLILEGAGHNLQGEVWFMIIGAIGSLSGDPDFSIDRTSSEWTQCSSLAFRCLKLIVDDFLDQLPSATDADERAQTSLLDCCSSFVCSRQDLNTSLTAIGLLWTIADQDERTNSFSSTLSKLAELASDGRAEVRNAAVNTLFSCIVGSGSNFSPEQWESCFSETIFGVHDCVLSHSNSDASHGGGDGGRRGSRYKVAHHHSRDSANKQWIATLVLVLRGLTRVLRTFFTQLLESTDSVDQGTNREEEVPWFQDAWVKILDLAYEAASQDAGRDFLDIRGVGVELLVVCAQLSSKAGIQAATSPARVGTNMEVVNGALRSVREAQPSLRAAISRSHSMSTEISRKNLFLEAFESLESFEEVLAKKADNDEELPDDTDIQVLHKFVAGLARLYDCCRQHEFAVDNRERSLLALRTPEASGEAGEETDLESRFVKLVYSVLLAASEDRNARFLNQAQRAALDLLRAMGHAGSSQAHVHLVRVAGSFFRTGGEDSSTKDREEDKKTVAAGTLLQKEAAVAVAEAAASKTVVTECKALIFYQVLHLLQSYASSAEPTSACPNFKLLEPILLHGLEGTSELASEGSYANEVDLVWEKLCGWLSKTFEPVSIGDELMRIPGLLELSNIVTCARRHVQSGHSESLSAILSSGAAQAFHIACSNAIAITKSDNSEAKRKSQKERNDLLKFFALCFSEGASLSPDDKSLRATARRVLAGALEEPEEALRELSTEAALIVCEAMCKNPNMESIVISVFALLCRLVGSDNSFLRDAATKVFAAVDISDVLQTAQNRYEAAERKAIEAEREVADLTATIQRLQEQNEKLVREVAVLEASNTML